MRSGGSSLFGNACEGYVALSARCTKNSDIEVQLTETCNDVMPLTNNIHLPIHVHTSLHQSIHLPYIPMSTMTIHHAVGCLLVFLKMYLHLNLKMRGIRDLRGVQSSLSSRVVLPFRVLTNRGGSPLFCPISSPGIHFSSWVLTWQFHSTLRRQHDMH